MIPSILLGVVGGLLIIGSYGAIESHWPGSYVNVHTRTGQLGRFSGLWFLVFRMTPAFVVTGVVAVTAERLELGPILATASCLAAFLFHGLRHAWLYEVEAVDPTKIWLVRFVNQVLSLVGGLLGFWSRAFTAPVIPSPVELLNAVWTAMVAGVAYFGVSRILGRETTSQELLDRARRDIGRDAWSYAKAASQIHALPLVAVQAIILAEAVQRPRWFRELERLLPSILRLTGRTATTGIAQMRSTSSLSDEKSLELLCLDMKEWLSSHPDVSLQDIDDFEDYATHHSADAVFVDSAASFHGALLGK